MATILYPNLPHLSARRFECTNRFKQTPPFDYENTICSIFIIGERYLKVNTKNSGFQYEGTGEKKEVVRVKIDDIYTAGRKEGD